MMPFELTTNASNDLFSIIENLVQYRGADAANQTSHALFEAFDELSQYPGLGHRRTDLTKKPFLFHFVDPHFIVYLRDTDPLLILGIFHSSRDLRKLLRKR